MTGHKQGLKEKKKNIPGLFAVAEHTTVYVDCSPYVLKTRAAVITSSNNCSISAVIANNNAALSFSPRLKRYE